MSKDVYTIKYVYGYIVIVFVCLVVTVVGALSLSQTPFFSFAYIASTVKSPLYKAQFYVQDNGLMDILAARKVRVFAENRDAASVPVLMYHGVTKKSGDSEINLTIQEFKDHMRALKRAGYTTISLEDFLIFIQGEQVLPARPVLITFDDGRRDSFYNGGPILAALNFTAVMYPIGMFTEEATGPTGVYYLSGREIAMLSRSDTWDIGSHSYNGHRQIDQNGEGTNNTYFFGGRMWIPDANKLESLDEFRMRVRDDLVRSRALFEAITGTEVNTLAFPFGNYGEVTKTEEGGVAIKNTVLSEAHSVYDLLFYQSSPQQYFTQAYRAPDPTSRERTLVRRITITSDMTGADLVHLLESGSAKSLPFTSTMTTGDGWVEAWGTLKLQNGELTLDAEGRGSGAATVLDGTRHWVDYRVEADAVSENGSSIVLMVRHDSEGDSVVCNYGRNFVHINQIVDGVERVVRGADNLPVLDGVSTTVRIAAEVSGRTMRCFLNDQVLVETDFLDPLLGRGGVGIKTWNQFGNARIVIHSLKVSAIE